MWLNRIARANPSTAKTKTKAKINKQKRLTRCCTGNGLSGGRAVAERQEAPAIIQARNDDGLDQGGNGEKFLKVQVPESSV